MHASVAAHQDSTGRGRFYKILTALALTLALSMTALAFAQSATAGHAGEDEDSPTITSFSPESASPGTYVWIDGEDFTQGDTLSLGGIQVAHDVYSETRIGFTVPDLSAANYALEIQNDAGRASLCCLEVTQEDAATDSSDAGSDVGDEDQQPDGTTTATTTGTSSDSSCEQAKKNIQCNQFGRIEMPAQADIRGEPIEITTKIWLNTNYKDQESRATLFSIRNVTGDGGSPVSIALKDFSTDAGEIYTTRVETHPNEINIWVDVLDLPTNTEITLTVLVGSTERGAYQLATLVMPFDRGYEPIKDSSGRSISLYSFTLLGVNGETGEVSSGDGGAFFGKIPGFGMIAAVVALGAVALGLSGRRKA